MYNKLSADPTALILGILSLVIVLLGCCCGFLVIISLILGIVGLVLANKSLAEFYQNSENYSVQSQKNVYAGKVLSIIGIALSGLFIMVFAVFMFFYQQNFTELLRNKYYESKNIRIDIQDSTKNINKTDRMYNEKDSVYSDSVSVDTSN
jgi:uncharacterized membrane protein